MEGRILHWSYWFLVFGGPATISYLLSDDEYPLMEALSLGLIVVFVGCGFVISSLNKKMILSALMPVGVIIFGAWVAFLFLLDDVFDKRVFITEIFKLAGIFGGVTFGLMLLIFWWETIVAWVKGH